MLSWSDLRMPDMPSVTLPEMPQISLPSADDATREPYQPVQIYRWQGADGSIQFSNETPPERVDYELVEVNPDANLIQAVPTGDTGSNDKTGMEEESAASSSLPSPLTGSPGEAMQLMEDAHKLRELSEERLRQHEALIQ